MRRVRLAVASVLALLLASCASQPARTPPPADPGQARQGDARRAAIVDWSLAGRLAISNGRQGGSGRIDWRQQGAQYTISLAAPVTRQSWRLVGDADGARLEGLEGGTRAGGDVEALLRTATGWDIPVRALVDWVRGTAAPSPAYGDAQVTRGAEGLPAWLEQAGWRIEFREWYEAGVGQPALPKRIEARREEARVRLVVDGWTVVPGADAAPQASADVPADDAPPDVALERALHALTLDDPAADMRARVAAGDLRPVGVCGFACLAPGFGPGGRAVVGGEMRILDGSGDVIRGDRHLQLKARAEAYARVYNQALAAWNAAHPEAAGAGRAD